MKYFFLLLLTACGPMTQDDLSSEASTQCTKLTQILREIDNKDDLIKNLPKIKKRYDKIADLVIQVREIPDKTEKEPSGASDDLFVELARLYEIPGCRELIESVQMDAIHRLH